ncbi:MULTISPECIES: MarR family winged helix-turn-helix transcriptional regulator [Actinomadura]|uniref:Winged helix DNA-binding protein n=2 Tax=Actinomadura TaxID=1988 RepID=A0A5D0NA41_9ACTN|nr:MULTISPECIES: MarR family transcriptional regulator [Actinomadura]TYB41181.1 winged helix DNA-binding protein [Actinomadura chibensis]TYK52309.1 winged helix DNA-binding protein [Actinomadura decatromicini]
MAAEPNIGVLLFIAYRSLENHVFAELAAAGHDDITQAQAKLLQRVDEDGSRLSDLAESAQVTKQTAGYLVDQLEKAGYVERTIDPADARARLVRLTAQARALRPVGDAAVAEVEARWTAHLGKRRMDQLHDILTRLREITDPYLDR